ncbi:hypothetical protein Deipr_0583 [Deinococcus proteolyticus MRP]|uniref:Uncharacterized protein n=1 Tax=Deinococcus proteolyticus (strain ATCC 35074 / DSM 20540 / JCM 6276 / NBRC 101906 / NCIMB 13154 / VKM Ac-1939 / CCM 2703 / MRP) TaxID=693977 RepID=F0RKX2_DEIPM|nr:hypothetical protein [Deinococcus proteolyticus]ADY25745.1 hypothetical protein Deipr_0583 [Deinococcus proteolyticus MRP]
MSDRPAPLYTPPSGPLPAPEPATGNPAHPEGMPRAGVSGAHEGENLLLPAGTHQAFYERLARDKEERKAKNRPKKK